MNIVIRDLQDTVDEHICSELRPTNTVSFLNVQTREQQRCLSSLEIHGEKDVEISGCTVTSSKRYTEEQSSIIGGGGSEILGSVVKSSSSAANKTESQPRNQQQSKQEQLVSSHCYYHEVGVSWSVYIVIQVFRS